MYDLIRSIQETDAAGIVRTIEGAIRDGALHAGSRLPTVRALADGLEVSPNTVASAYRQLRSRGLLVTRGRKGTRVAPRPPLAVAAPTPVPAGVRNLADGNPDPALFPRLDRAVAALDLKPRLYGEEANDPELVRIATDRFKREGLPVGRIAVVGGALDAIERILRAELRPGDRIALEDPGYSTTLDLARTLGLDPVPVAVDERGPLPSSLFGALDAGARAFVLTPRAQNPTGAAIDAARASELRDALDRYPEVLVIEDDHAGPISGAPAVSTCDASRPRFAIVRSVAKSLGPDLRLALLNGDPATIARVQGRQMLGAGWVSKILQQLVVAQWKDRTVRDSLRRTEELYATRRKALLDALAERNIFATGSSGLNIWLPVPEETPVVQKLFEAGFAVTGGERFRIDSPPAIRITTATLRPDEVERLATSISQCLAAGERTRTA